MSAAVHSNHGPSHGSARIPQGRSTIPPSDVTYIDRAVAVLHESKDAWVEVGVADRIELLRRLRRDTKRVMKRWVSRAIEAKGIEAGTPAEAEEWFGGPFTVLRNLRLLERSLEEIAKHGRPIPPGKPRALPDGQLAVPVFPYEPWDKVLYSGFTAEIWMEPGVTEVDLAQHQAEVYRRKAAGDVRPGKVACVLGAGNVSSIGPMDALYKLFVEDQVVVLKMNPVNEYTGPFVAEAFQVLVERGFLRLVYGGAREGAYLCRHPQVEEIHITGSDKTHDAIVYGVGPEGERRKAAREPVNTRRITSELGNVSPVIVVPGPWKAADFEFQAQNLATMLANNAGFNCNATRVIVNHAGWEGREALLSEVRRVFRSLPTRHAYYPGAAERHRDFVVEHPEAETFGSAEGEHLPWTLIPGLDPAKAEDLCFTTEAFCSVTGEVALPAASVPDYIAEAVRFANDTVWGTLNASILVHPQSLKDPAVAAAVERAIRDLRHGSVVVNHWAAISYGLCTTTWGGFPGAELHDVRSGIGVVHNTLMFDRPQKTVIRGPFRVFPPPPWFATNPVAHRVAKRMADFEADPSWLKVPGIAFESLKRG